MASDHHEFSAKTTDFALDLFRQTASQKPGGNLVFSPASVAVALAMAHRGAQGKTRAQMGQRLFGDLSDDQVNEGLVKLTQLLNQTPSDGLTLNTANRLFIDTHFKFLGTFLEETKKVFHAEPENVPFADDSPKAVKCINSWVKETTHGKISNIFEELSNDVKLVIANAIYFKGDWAKPFEESSTCKGDFHVNAQKSVQLDFMHAERKFTFAANDEMQLLALPYVKDELQMVFILPHERFGLDQLEKSLTGAKLWEWISNSRKSTVNVSLPKFKLETSLGLVEALKQLGMSEMFSSHADFSKITSDGALAVSDVVHKAFLEVNEKGAEAAAVTAVTMVRCCAVIEREEKKFFVADQPFLFAIVERSQSNVLFFGHFHAQ